jgi:hypothetical protein
MNTGKPFEVETLRPELFRLFKSGSLSDPSKIGHEKPVFICPYQPGQELEMRSAWSWLVTNLELEGKSVTFVNLFEELVNHLSTRGLLSSIVESESAGELGLENLRGLVDIEGFLQQVMGWLPLAQSKDLLLIGGVGEVYPHLRASEIIGKLEKYTVRTPVVLFFPGSYVHSSGQSMTLRLFDKLEDSHYYRAMNLYQLFNLGGKN